MQHKWKKIPYSNLTHYLINRDCIIVNGNRYPNPENARKTIHPDLRNHKLFIKLKTPNSTKRIYPQDFLVDLFPDLAGQTIAVKTKDGPMNLELPRQTSDGKTICLSCFFAGFDDFFSFKDSMCDSCYQERGEMIRYVAEAKQYYEITYDQEDLDYLPEV